MLGNTTITPLFQFRKRNFPINVKKMYFLAPLARFIFGEVPVLR
ncbi:hypothetical protein GLIP_4028 [Aliiglaciecola lipolytica E3]|uniref:Uncharacterized protein n=1 Tax=Aliiglaciecola lipolytica E3 TaxID=1127673 RepID=K6X7N4_9ALTE|nr:hypothetical protein GLIP_4028 [Aliiglaciecola lipolytica E3]